MGEGGEGGLPMGGGGGAGEGGLPMGGEGGGVFYQKFNIV